MARRIRGQKGMLTGWLKRKPFERWPAKMRYHVHRLLTRVTYREGKVLLPPPWLDLPNARELAVRRAGNRADFLKAANELLDAGFAVLPNWISAELCDATVRDFGSYVETNREYAEKCKDRHGRYLRLVNFHLASSNALAIGLDRRIMEVLDFIFGCKAGIYTSLYFEYGTEQPIHRDSPFFETFPRNYFVGVWVALEDIKPESGPLMYLPSGHRFECDPRPIYAEVRNRLPGASQEELVRQSLETYYGRVNDKAMSIGKPVAVSLKKGDVAIWHAQAPHGGSSASNRALTRRSIVFHDAPECVQVYQHDVFFTHPGPNPPPPRYGFMQQGDRKVALAGDTAFQV